jgi:hypothetical protein
MAYLVIRVGRYNVLLQCLVFKFKKKLLLIKKKQKYLLLYQMCFFHCRTQIKGFMFFITKFYPAYIIKHVMTRDHTCDFFSPGVDEMSCNPIMPWRKCAARASAKNIHIYYTNQKCQRNKDDIQCESI